ncbi:MAG: hypothetical protein KC419_19585 [Anaerolineales bacterium]|nr:hypothetical protein [Anaerolineales bacterium]
MLEKVHHHIVSELGQSARTDTIFVVTAVVFNLIVLGINSAVAGEAASSAENTAANDVTMIIFIALAIFVNVISITALIVGKQTRGKLLSGLLSMYRDQKVDKYYDASLLTNYDKRYWMFTAVILCLAVTAVLVPLVIRFL